VTDDDLVFKALADPTRRHLLDRLFVRDGRTLTELESELEMTRFGVMKHLRVLEEAGLVVRAKEGRTVRCELAPRVLEDAAMWLARYEKFWSAQLDALGRYLYHQEEVQAWPSEAPKQGPSSGSAATTRSAPKRSGARGPTRKR
jgi:DNA-binding transcriptional ArsR family regulator